MNSGFLHYEMKTVKSQSVDRSTIQNSGFLHYEMKTVKSQAVDQSTIQF